MIQNYLIVAIRNLKRHGLYSTINIIGLSIGIACCLLMTLFVMDELSYDQFHEKADRTYRIVKKVHYKGDITKTAKTYSSLAPALKNYFPEIEIAVRVYHPEPRILQTDTRMKREEGLYYVDADFLDVFSFELISGDPGTILIAPNSLVLTEELAQTLFPAEDAMGRVVSIGSKDFRVTGVVQNPPANSHLQFSVLASLTTLGSDIVSGVFTDRKRIKAIGSYTYVVLPRLHPEAEFQRKLNQFALTYEPVQSITKRGGGYEFSIQPIADIRLHSHLEDEIVPTYDVAYVYLFSALASLVLAIACINFVNLSTARFSQRTQEVGVRKVIGANRYQLILQFLTESLLMATFALLLALGIVEMALPWFNGLADKSIIIHYDNAFLFGIIGFALVVGLAGGGYPAFLQSGFHPMAALKRVPNVGSRSNLRRILVVIQFAVSIGVLIGFVTVFQQLQYMKTKRLGLDAEQILIVPVDFSYFPDSWKSIKAEWLRDPRISSISASWQAPGVQRNMAMKFEFQPEGFGNEAVRFRAFVVDHDFLDVYGTKVVAGRGFSKAFETDEKEAFILNQSAVKALGWKDPIGKKFDTKTFQNIRNYGRGHVIGVVEDFHFQSFHHSVEPAVLMLANVVAFYSVRIASDDVAGTLADLQNTWRKFAPEQTMMYYFLDDVFAQYYHAEERLMELFAAFTGLAIVIACLGLFGLSAFVVERKTKEIGIRKIMGASIGGIILLLSGDFLKLVFLANLISWPIAYWATQDWLTNFAYRIDASWGIFLFSGGLALGVALMTVGFQAWKAACANPVDALRYE